MEHQTIIWIKQEEFPEDSLEYEGSVKRDGDLDSRIATSEAEFLGDPSGVVWSNDFTKDDTELNLEEDETEDLVVPSTIYGTDSTRLVETFGESCAATFGEAVDRGAVSDSRQERAEGCTHVTTCGSHSRGEVLVGTKLKCSSGENGFHTFSCSFCQQSFPSKYLLIMHVFTHIDGAQPPKYVCRLCGDVFPSIISLRNHCNMSEGDQALYAGNNEETVSSNHDKNINILEDDRNFSIMEQIDKQSSYEKHSEIANKSFNDVSNTFTLTHDAEKADRNDNYETLSTSGSVTTKRPHQCNICGKSFTQLSYLKSHVVEHSGNQSHVCNICGKTFDELGTFKRHTIEHTGMKTHECDICGKTFPKPSAFKNHMLTHIGDRSHTCDICGSSFITLSTLRKHTIIHTGIKPHKCDICGKCFTQVGTLKRHVLIHAGIKPHKCDVCGKSFSQPYHLKSHVLLHSGQRSHVCNICGKTFTELGTLKRHAAVHTGMKPHKCNICGKAFVAMGTLKSHALIHSGIKPHKCDICAKSFTKLSTLKSHMLTHTGQRSHTCDICGKSFTLSQTLTSHRLIHTGFKPHKCVICDTYFARLSNLKSHMVQHVGEKSQT